MGLQQHQEFWLVGGRTAFKPDGQDSLFDLGTIQASSLSPGVTAEVLELFDPDGGTKVRVDEAPTQVDTTFNITTYNCSLDNLAFFMMSSEPETYSQAMFIPNPRQYRAVAGRFLKLLDQSGSEGAYMTKIVGVATGALGNVAVTSITAATRTIQGSFGVALAEGTKVYLVGQSLALDDNRELTVSSGSTTGQIIVDEPISQDYGGGVATIIVPAASATRGVDYEATQIEEDRGMLRILNGGALDDTQVTPIFVQKPIAEGKRLIRPQFAKKAVTGQGYIYFSRGDHERETVQECRMSLTPANSAFDVENYSTLQFTAKLLADPTNAGYPGGRMLQFKGDVPSMT